MLQFVVDQGDPLGTLEDCGIQLDFLVDVLSQGGSDGIEFGDTGAAGLADLLRAISRAMNTAGRIIREVLPAGLESIESATDAPIEEAPEPARETRRALIARLLQEEGDARETISGAGASSGGAGEAIPRLIEPRSPARHRRAA